MAETKRALATLLTNLADNTAGAISEEDVRDAILTLFDGLYTPAISSADANPTVTIGTLTTLDISGFTAGRTFTLPTTAAVGDRVGVMITTGDDAYELAIRTGAASDTINGVDHSASDFTKLFITGEVMIFKCVVADTDWIVEHDGRIPCRTRLIATSSQLNLTNSTFVLLSLHAEEYDVGDLGNVANDRIDIRRSGEYRIGCGFVILDILDTKQATGQFRIDGTTIGRINVGLSPANGSACPCFGTRSVNISDGSYVDATAQQNTGTSTQDIWYSSPDGVAYLEVEELL